MKKKDASIYDEYFNFAHTYSEKYNQTETARVMKTASARLPQELLDHIYSYTCSYKDRNRYLLRGSSSGERHAWLHNSDIRINGKYYDLRRLCLNLPMNQLMDIAERMNKVFKLKHTEADIPGMSYVNCVGNRVKYNHPAIHALHNTDREVAVQRRVKNLRLQWGFTTTKTGVTLFNLSTDENGRDVFTSRHECSYIYNSWMYLCNFIIDTSKFWSNTEILDPKYDQYIQKTLYNFLRQLVLSPNVRKAASQKQFQINLPAHGKTVWKDIYRRRNASRRQTRHEANQVARARAREELKQSRQAARDAAKAAKVAKREAAKAAKVAERDAAKAAKVAEREAAKAAKVAEREAAKAAKVATRQAERDAAKAAKVAERDAAKAAKVAERDAAKAAKQSNRKPVKVATKKPAPKQAEDQEPPAEKIIVRVTPEPVLPPEPDQLDDYKLRKAEEWKRRQQP